MNIIDRIMGRRSAETRASPEDPTVPVSAENFLQFFGVQSTSLPNVTLDNAMQVPAFAASHNFLSSSMANLPLHAYRSKGENASRVGGKLQRIVNEAPNTQWTSYGMRKYLWQGVFGSAGRGCAWIERKGTSIEAIWPFEHGRVHVSRKAGRKWYHSEGRDYPAEDVIDLTFLLKSDMLSVYSPLHLAAKAVQLSIAMGDYGANFFAGGGVPPLAFTGPLPAGKDAMRQALTDMKRSVEASRSKGDAMVPIPPGHELKPIGFDPAKGQMTEARRFQIEEIARVFNLPPVFVQDLTHGTFSNTEQQDLHLIKHVLAQWAKMAEEEFNLKLFGVRSGGRYVEHSMDAIERGDFKSRMEGMAQSVQNALRTPNELRGLDNLPPKPNGDDLMIQGATVPLGRQTMQGEATPERCGAGHTKRRCWQ